MKDEIEVVQKEEDGQVKDENVGNSTETVYQDMELGVYNVNEKVLHGNVPDVTGAIATDVATEVCNEKELSSNSDLDRNLDTALQGEDVQEESLTSSSENARDAPNKRLSASAAPFNPSPATVNEEETKELDSPALDMINIDTTTAEISLENEKEKDEVRTSRVEISGSKVNGHNYSKENRERCRGRHVLGHTKRIDAEGSFTILLRGKWNRKQILRMPISLLNKLYGSQSFKLVYNRVVRGAEEPKSSSGIFPSSDGTTNVPSESFSEGEHK